MRTVLEVVRLSSTYLSDHGSTSGRLDAELLAARALGLRRLDLYLQFDRPLTDDELGAIRELVRRRGRGEPVAYITGHREFFGRSFRVTRDVLIPRPETELVVERVLAWARAAGDPLSIADLGTGSGCIACTLAAELPSAVVVATDISKPALEIAAGNARALGVIDRVLPRRGRWGAALTPADQFDAMVSNPPYVTRAEMESLERDVRDFEPRRALDGGQTGLRPYAALVAAARRHLRPGGLLAVEVDPRRVPAVVDMMASAGCFAAPEVVDDLTGRARAVLATVS